MKNLEQIQETDHVTRMPKTVSFALVGLGVGCVVFAALALNGRKNTGDTKKADPLAELIDRSKSHAVVGAKADLTPKDVTFPSMLSDNQNPTTALAALRGQQQQAAAAPGVAGAAVVDPGVPPPATDRLPVVPLPAGAVLEATPIVTRPRDALTRAAVEQETQAENAGGMAPAGSVGGYQLQVSSYRTQAEADTFANQLRARSHKAYVTEAHVQGRGTWYRVRIGPFSSQREAAQYRVSFEGRERVVPFIVPPNQK